MKTTTARKMIRKPRKTMMEKKKMARTTKTTTKATTTTMRPTRKPRKIKRKSTKATTPPIPEPPPIPRTWTCPSCQATVSGTSAATRWRHYSNNSGPSGCPGRLAPTAQDIAERGRQRKERKKSSDAYRYEQVLRPRYGYLSNDMACSDSEVELESLDEDERRDERISMHSAPTRKRSYIYPHGALDRLMAGARKRANATPSKVSECPLEETMYTSDDEIEEAALRGALWCRQSWRRCLEWARGEKADDCAT